MRSLVPIVFLCAGALALTGCGGIDVSKVEADIDSGIEQQTNQPVDSVDCPDDVENETGTTFECTAVVQTGADEDPPSDFTETLPVEAEVTDADGGEVSWQLIDPDE